MREDLPARLRAGAEILLQCPEHVRLKRDHAPMDANLYRRADEANEAADEIERLRAEVERLRQLGQRNAQSLREYAAALGGEMADLVADECKITVKRMAL